MLTHEELQRIAAQLLGVPQVEQYFFGHEDEQFICFEHTGGYPPPAREDFVRQRFYNRFCLVDTETGQGVVYDMGADMESESRTAGLDFHVGLRSQKYRLEVLDIRDWDRTRLLLYGLRLPLNSVEGLQLPQPESPPWLDSDITPLQKQYEQQGVVAFNNVDINGYYQVLVGGRHYGCLNFKLFAYDEATHTVGEMIVPDDLWEIMFKDQYESGEEYGQGEEEFWEYVRYGRG